MFYKKLECFKQIYLYSIIKLKISPDIKLPEPEIKVGVASTRELLCPLKYDYLLRATNIKGITVYHVDKRKPS